MSLFSTIAGCKITFIPCQPVPIISLNVSSYFNTIGCSFDTKNRADKDGRLLFSLFTLCMFIKFNVAKLIKLQVKNGSYKVSIIFTFIIPIGIYAVENDGGKTVAITDYGNMFGVPKFVAEAKKKGVLPVVGCEFYLAHGSREDRTKGEGN